MAWYAVKHGGNFTFNLAEHTQNNVTTVLKGLSKTVSRRGRESGMESQKASGGGSTHCTSLTPLSYE